ncbi:MAG: YhfX family PLP-dependent enzyme [Streptococcaceae bacterium]|nr:YhfX family PLP-dependent enzyme [Streptococcaceae bacterium]
MFLTQLEKQNPELIKFAFALHESGEILPDTYVIDLDRIEENAGKIAKAASDNEIELFYMTKQLGRNPIIAQTIADAGIEKAVAVDFREAEILMHNKLALGNIGHLVQVPRKLLEKIVQYGTKYMTEFTLENLHFLNQTAYALNKQQKVLLKVVADSDIVYPGQTGGFTLRQLQEQLSEIQSLSNVIISGITTFPAILLNEERKLLEATPNLETIMAAQKILEAHGIENPVIDLPSATSCASMPLLKKIGATVGEPGHALSGTTPLHAVTEQPEQTAYCYLSEISHSFKEHSYFYGGGYYRRGHLTHALVKMKGDHETSCAKVLPLESTSIDYYLELDKLYNSGTAVICCPRSQIFVTRSTVALIKGLHKGKPELIGLYDSLGKELPEGMK